MFKNKNGLPKTSANPTMPEVKPPLKIETHCKVDQSLSSWIRVEHNGNPLSSGLYIVQVKTKKGYPTVHDAYWSGLRWSNLRICGETVIAWMELPTSMTMDEINSPGETLGEALNRFRQVSLKNYVGK